MLSTKGKTEYRFTVQDAQDAEQKIQSWLSINSFQRMQEGNIVYYRSGDVLVSGYRFFEYNINGAQLTVYAYVGSVKKPRALEGMYGAIWISEYKNQLGSLFAVLNNNVQPQQPVNNGMAQSQNQPQPQPQPQNTYAKFKQDVDKKNATCAEVSFWISIVLFAASFLGFLAGAILVMLNAYLAAQGMKSDKKGKAIAAIVMTGISLVIAVLVGCEIIKL